MMEMDRGVDVKFLHPKVSTTVLASHNNIRSFLVSFHAYIKL